MKKQLRLSSALFAVALLAITGCASTAMKRFVGEPIEEAFMAYGEPVNIIDLPDGRRGYQFYWGGGTYVSPGTATSTGSTVGGITTVRTVAQPAAVIESEGCLVTLIATDAEPGAIVQDYRIPKRLVC